MKKTMEMRNLWKNVLFVRKINNFLVTNYFIRKYLKKKSKTLIIIVRTDSTLVVDYLFCTTRSHGSKPGQHRSDNLVNIAHHVFVSGPKKFI